MIWILSHGHIGNLGFVVLGRRGLHDQLASECLLLVWLCGGLSGRGSLRRESKGWPQLNPAVLGVSGKSVGAKQRPKFELFVVLLRHQVGIYCKNPGGTLCLPR